ncbi:hypothetical protein [Ralstonia mannitolilytica]|uniref:hypothetical protein n=1 Tax=Ralstonia mannitolilytica TaxID=105219 RepID=UPI001C94C45B|nr:hypothetical protein [Ralstonia mannitolilytica]MBY4717560.1 hypothetical protein [Ralstonia mannitolilytica]
MKKIILTIAALLSINAFAGSISTNIQVSATVLPYCRVIVDGNQTQSQCMTNKSAPVTTTLTSTPQNTPSNVPSVITKETSGSTTTITITY